MDTGAGIVIGLGAVVLAFAFVKRRQMEHAAMSAQIAAQQNQGSSFFDYLTVGAQVYGATQGGRGKQLLAGLAR